MADAMALFEAELSMMDSPAEEKQVEKTPLPEEKPVDKAEEKQSDKTPLAEAKQIAKVAPAMGKLLKKATLAKEKPTNTATPAEEKLVDKAENAAVKRGHTDAQETELIVPKVSVAKEAVQAWKKKRILDAAAELAAEQAAWSEHKDASNAGLYYFNNVTKKSAWTLPPDAKTPKWQVTTDYTSGHLYYVDKESGESTWERPADLGPENNIAVDTTESTEASGEAGGTSKIVVGEKKAATPISTVANCASDQDRDVDEEFDLTNPDEPDDGIVIEKSDSSESEIIYARVVAESEEGTSVVGFSLRLNTPFDVMFEKWAEYQELPVESVYFLLETSEDALLLSAGETPDDFSWSRARGTMKIEAKPCEEIVDEEAEKEAERHRETVSKWKKKQQKQRRAGMKEHQEELQRTGNHLQ